MLVVQDHAALFHINFASLDDFVELIQAQMAEILVQVILSKTKDQIIS
jgi:hypothetical protein